MSSVRCQNLRTAVRYGRNDILLLTDGNARPALDDALDPLPRRSGTWVAPGDPFENRDRPLYLAIASDCKGLRPSILRALISLGRLPAVRVDVMPGLVALSAKGTEQISWSGQDLNYRVVTSREPEWTHLIELDEELVSLAVEFLGMERTVAERSVLEARIFESLVYDYLVSESLTAYRNRSRRVWPNQLGAVTPSEAFRLAGAKARMYGMLPEQHDSGVNVSTNVGMIYDRAATRLTPGLINALMGAAGSDEPPQASVVPFLLGIRARLNQLLVARDEVYRLTRREALGLIHRSSADERNAPGLTGNDLRAALIYHAAMAMDASYAAGDALAWVAAIRDTVDPARAPEIGLGHLLVGERKWTTGDSALAMRRALLAVPGASFSHAVRELRNRYVHRDGMERGRLAFHPPLAGPEPSVVWVDDATFKGHPRSAEFFQAIAERANYANDTLAVMTVLRLVDEIWCSTSSTVTRGLGPLSWGPRKWMRATPGRGRHRPTLWRNQTQRLLWGIPTGKDRLSVVAPPPP